MKLDFSSGNRTRTCLRRGGYEPSKLFIKKASYFYEA
jgi:hypothetical protein